MVYLSIIQENFIRSWTINFFCRQTVASHFFRWCDKAQLAKYLWWLITVNKSSGGGAGHLVVSKFIDTIKSQSTRQDNNAQQLTFASLPLITLHYHKICISRYVSPSTLTKYSKHKNNEVSDVGPTWSRLSRVGVIFDFHKHCTYNNYCTLPDK